MLKYKVKLPDQNIKLINDKGAITDEKNVIIHLIGIIIENFVQQKSDTDAYIIKKIREKIDNVNGENFIIFEKEEIHILKETIKRMQESGQVVGSNWYYLIDGLRTSEEIKESVKNNKEG